MSDILCIAERVNDPAIPDERVARWQRYWCGKDRIDYILSTPAMTRGSTMGRLHRLLGFKPDLVVNLLWPDNKIGTWDLAEARMSAGTVLDWLFDDRTFGGIILLGRRVVDAFGIRDREWGTTVAGPRGTPMLLMPHPSGRNRLLNEASFCSRLRESAGRFAALQRGSP